MMRDGVLAGVIRQVAERWEKTLRATPVSAFWGDPEFQRAYGQEHFRIQIEKNRQLFHSELEELLADAAVRADLARGLSRQAKPGKGESRHEWVKPFIGIQLVEVQPG